MSNLEFVRKCCQGDKPSWDDFAERYSRLIYKYIHCAARVSGLSLKQEDIDDIFQEVFVSLSKDDFRKLKSFQAKNGCSFATWLRQVTINLTFGFLRASRGMVSLDEEGEGPALKEVLVDGSARADRLSQEEEVFQGLKDCIGRLSGEDKFFVELHINQGLTLDTLKGFYKVSRGSIDMRKARIISRLKDCFREKGFFKLD